MARVQKNKSIKRVLIILFCIVFLIAGVIGYGIYWAFFDIGRIKGEQFLAASTSPENTYTITAYINNGGAMTSYAVLGVLTNNETGKKRNIYWEYRCDRADIEWLDDETVVINDIELNVTKDIYDFRREN